MHYSTALVLSEDDLHGFLAKKTQPGTGTAPYRRDQHRVPCKSPVQRRHAIEDQLVPFPLRKGRQFLRKDVRKALLQMRAALFIALVLQIVHPLLRRLR